MIIAVREGKMKRNGDSRENLTGIRGRARVWYTGLVRLDDIEGWRRDRKTQKQRKEEEIRDTVQEKVEGREGMDENIRTGEGHELDQRFPNFSGQEPPPRGLPRPRTLTETQTVLRFRRFPEILYFFQLCMQSMRLWPVAIKIERKCSWGVHECVQILG